MYKTIFCVLFVIFSMMVATDLQAPEITSHEIFGFDIFRIAENGSILNEEGVIKGWICGSTVYDAQWNSMH